MKNRLILVWIHSLSTILEYDSRHQVCIETYIKVNLNFSGLFFCLPLRVMNIVQSSEQAFTLAIEELWSHCQEVESDELRSTNRHGS